MSSKTVIKQPSKKEEPKHPEAKGTTETEPIELEKPISTSDLQAAIEALAKVVAEHTRQISELQETLARKRRPVASNGKIQIRDKKTNKVYPSKNNAYQSLLKAGELKELVDKGVFGPTPEKNTFGWYTLAREWPDRFEEVKPEKALTDGKP